MDDAIADDVRKHGWSVADVYDGEPPFLYTIGLMQTWNHPELILFGLKSKTAYSILAAMVHSIRSGQSFHEPGSYSGVLEGDFQIGLRAVHPTQHQVYLGYAMGYVRQIGRMGELQAMQAFWPDKAGKFPFEVGCDLDVFRLQPRLDLALTPSEIEEFEREFGP
jgi:hypothetical protein